MLVRWQTWQALIALLDEMGNFACLLGSVRPFMTLSVLCVIPCSLFAQSLRHGLGTSRCPWQGICTCLGPVRRQFPLQMFQVQRGTTIVNYLEFPMPQLPVPTSTQRPKIDFSISMKNSIFKEAIDSPSVSCISLSPLILPGIKTTITPQGMPGILEECPRYRYPPLNRRILQYYKLKSIS